jgi:phytoene/squalene synthetase
MNDEDDDSALARRHSAEALRVLAEIADDPKADTAVREEAGQALEKWLVRLKELGQESTLSPHVRRELENTIRKFRHS